MSLPILVYAILRIMFQTAMPILDKLDPYQFFITYKLFRDATRSVNGTPVKVRIMS